MKNKNIELMAPKKRDTHLADAVHSVGEMMDEGTTIIGCELDSLATADIISNPDHPSSTNPMISLDYLNALCPLLIALELNNHSRDHHETETAIKRFLLINSATLDFTSSLNKLLLSYGITALATLTPAGLIIQYSVALLEFINAANNYYHASKELDFAGWLEERVAQVNHLTKKIDKLEKKYLALDITEDETLLKKQQALMQTIKKLKGDKKTLLNHMQSRCRVYYHAPLSGKLEHKKEFANRQTVIDSKLKKLDPEKQQPHHGHTGQAGKQRHRKNGPTFFNNRVRHKIDYTTLPTKKDERIDGQIKHQLHTHHIDCRSRFYIRALTLAGLSVLLIAGAVCWPATTVAILAGIFCYASMACYAGYYSYKAHQYLTTEKPQTPQEITPAPKPPTPKTVASPALFKPRQLDKPAAPRPQNSGRRFQVAIING